ncbi:hypothetical protein [Phyllobacterium zundukense]|uniref:Uncharacterized protein n=1 Tax=Phyllobacterium zundukense TaxID=1867719 RepID=A0ACD4D7K5_9HYPH|nr:hypothetical protein [Phyllobacterium zundukense]UXN61729.1 hypothetical protein N8E88_16925 [Phyllobacterium zundukense]
MTKISLELRFDANPFTVFQASELTEVHSEAYELIGRILALWNRIEQDLTYLTFWLYPAFENDLPKKYQKMPRGLDAKLRLMSYLTKEYYELSVFKDEFEKHKSNIDAIKTDRHHIVHWAILNFEVIEDEFILTLINPESLSTKLETKTVTREQLLLLAQKLGVIGLSFGFFATEFDVRLREVIGDKK